MEHLGSSSLHKDSDGWSGDHVLVITTLSAGTQRDRNTTYARPQYIPSAHPLSEINQFKSYTWRPQDTSAKVQLLYVKVQLSHEKYQRIIRGNIWRNKPNWVSVWKENSSSFSHYDVPKETLNKSIIPFYDASWNSEHRSRALRWWKFQVKSHMCIFYFHFDLQLKNDKKLFELQKLWKTWNPPAASALWRLIKLLRRCSYQDVNLQNVCTCTKCTYICHSVSYTHTWQYGRLRYRLNYWRNLWIIFIQAGLKLKIIINSEYSPVLFFHNSHILKV